MVTNRPQSDSKPDDVTLLQRHVSGDDEAMGLLIGRYRRELFNFLARFTGDPELAEDVFQEAFLQLHISAALFDPSKRLKPWLFTIAANKARDALRSRGRRRAVSLDATIDGGADTASFSDLMPADIPAPDENVLNLETRQNVINIVNEMPDNLRLVLLLCYFHGMAYKEIAEVLDAPLGTVKSRIHAAVALFARKWQSAAGKLDDDAE